MTEFIEETLDGSAPPVKPAADRRRIETLGPGAAVSPGSTFGEPPAKAAETKYRKYRGQSPLFRTIYIIIR